MSKTVAAGGAFYDGFIGDIVTSMLTESQFQAQRNSGWVLMDGRSVGGSKYATVTGSNTLPDARGLALRGKNNGRADGKQNPDGDVVLGTYQADGFGTHTHIQNAHNHTQDAHSHTVTDPGHHHTITGGAGGAYGLPRSYDGNSAAVANATSTNTTGITIASATATNQVSTATNQTSGGNESRPKNITVNYFIKIN
jgi:hypothetical protein